MEGQFQDGTVEATELVVMASGTPTRGEYRCSECGYGVTVFSELPRCPMCSGETWAQTAWRPFSRSFAGVGPPTA